MLARDKGAGHGQRRKKGKKIMQKGTSAEGGGETGIMIMLRRQLFSQGEQLYPLKGMKPEPGQEPRPMPP